MERGVHWIDLAQGSDRWRVIVNAAMKLGFHKMRGISGQAGNRFTSQEGLYSMD
jgi:hypothetical protein